MKNWVTFFVFFLLPIIIFSQSDLKISGELRVRTELDGRDFLNRTYPQSFTALRARLGFEKKFNEHVSIFVQLQDSRVYGEEQNTLTSLKNIDLHQGYVSVKNIFDSPIYFTFGRFKLQYGKYKIFGPNDWHNVGRSHDGFIIGYNTDNYKTDLFLTTHNNFMSYRAGAARVYDNYNYSEAPPDTGFNIFGFYSTNKFLNSLTGELYSYYEWDRKRPNGSDMQLQRYTVGTALEFAPSPFPLSFRVEVAYQGGKIYSSKLKDISAMMILANLQFKPFDNLVLSLNADINSGCDPTKTDKYKLFDNPYSTKHNYQGFMDFFTGLSDPKFTTGIYGLNDYFFRTIYNFSKSFNAQLDLHYFTTFVTFVNSNNKEINEYGPEINLVLRYKMYDAVEFEWGSGAFIAGDVMKELYSKIPKRAGISTYDPAFWTYLQINFKF
ncbi:MAG: alginate export family protein [Ignavibacteria bacterium]|nr:alginate export family protein [Ignavibacteria bacterium]